MLVPNSDLPQPQVMLREPPDLDAAHDAWGANCGPAALAAALSLSLEDVREAVSFGGEFKGYMGALDMKAALEKLGALSEKYSASEGENLRAGLGPESRTIAMQPRMKLLLLQWDGPWRTVPRAAATYRHWIAYIHGFLGDRGPGWVYDVNSGWIDYVTWDFAVVPRQIPPRGTGQWSIAWGAGVRT